MVLSHTSRFQFQQFLFVPNKLYDTFLRPSPDNVSLGLGGDADIGAVGDLAVNESSCHGRRKREDDNDGVGAGITEPVLFEGRLLHEATTASRRRHERRSSGDKKRNEEERHREREKERIQQVSY